MNENDTSIEHDIQALETLIQGLEQNDINLNTAVDQYSKALDLASKTHTKLNTIQKNFTVLKEENKHLLEEPVSYENT